MTNEEDVVSWARTITGETLRYISDFAKVKGLVDVIDTLQARVKELESREVDGLREAAERVMKNARVRPGFTNSFVVTADLANLKSALSASKTALPSGLSEEESDAMNRVREGKWLRLDLVLNDVQVLAACVRRLIGERKS